MNLATRRVRAALREVLELAQQGRLDHTGEGAALTLDDRRAIHTVCRAFRLELPSLMRGDKPPRKRLRRRSRDGAK